MGKTADQTGRITAIAAAMVSCHSCGMLSRAPEASATARAVCPRCCARLHCRKPDSISRTWALVIAAMILYVPANLLPIMLVSAASIIEERESPL